jgi:glycosyltransferase involved in cell wall biosynthesis
VAVRFIHLGAVPRNKCSVLTNGIDCIQFSSAAVAHDMRPHGKNGFVWLAAGRPVPAKDFNNLLAAFQVVREKMPEAELWIAGAHRANKDVSRVEPEGVRWLGHCEDMATTIASTDAFVLSSAWEGMPLVVGEAMAMMKPVVATDVGGVRELVGDAGLIVPAKDSSALSTAMIRVMRMSEMERRALGDAARERIVRHFDMDAVAAKWEALYRRLLQTAYDGMVGLSADFQTSTDGE